MNREEILTRLLYIGNDIRDFCDGAKHMGDEDKKDIEALDYAIAKIKEESRTLDKIRAEIEQNAYPIVHGVNNHEKGMTLYGVLQIIDKYRA